MQGNTDGIIDLNQLYRKEWMDESQYKVSGNYTYRVINEAQKEIEIRKIDTTESVLNIPAEIDGYKVVSLGYSGKAWEDDGIQYLLIAETAEKNVTELIIPKGVKTVGNYAFNDYDKLIKVTFPEDVINIREASFAGCASLNDIVVLPGMILHPRAFAGCNSLKIVTDKCAVIFEEAFYGNKIEEYCVEPGNNNEFQIASMFEEATVDKLIVHEDVEVIAVPANAKINNLIIKWCRY